jgi:hypothetical protein
MLSKLSEATAACVQVAVLGDGNKVVLKSIQLGRDLGDTVEVTAGLPAMGI